MPENFSMIVLGASITGFVTFMVAYFRSRSEIKPHTSPCEHLKEMRKEMERQAERFNLHCATEASQWNTVAQNYGFISGSLSQLDKRFDNLEQKIEKGLVGRDPSNR